MASQTERNSARCWSMETMPFRASRQAQAFDILHDPVWLSRRSRSSIEKPRDAGVFELCEDLAFAAETLVELEIAAGAGD
jgi:hypothetical protein